MTVYGKGKRGLIEELRELRNHLDGLEHRNAELMQMQEMLQESVNQFKTIFDNTLIGLYRTTPEGQVLMANSALLKMLGYSSFDQLAQRNLEQGEYEPQYLRSAFKERVESEDKVIGLESVWKKSDGTTLYVRESAQAIRDESGNILYYQGTVEDITERRQAEEALRKARDELETRVQQRTAELQRTNEAMQAQITERVKTENELKKSKDILEKTFTSLDSAIFILDAKVPPVIVDCNPAATRIFGYSKEEMLGKTTEFLHVNREMLREFQRTLSRSIDEYGGLSFFEFKMQRKDGRVFPSEHSVRSLKDEEGLIIGWVSVVRDITERKRTEIELQESQQHLQNLIENMPIVCFTFERDGRILSWNYAAERIYGYSKDEAVGANAYDLIVTAATKNATDQTIQDVFNGKTVMGTEWQDHDKNGRIGWRMGNTFPLFNADGSVYCGVNMNIDITERKKAEEELSREKKFTDDAINAQIDTFYVFNPKTGSSVSWNKSFREISGYSDEEIAAMKAPGSWFSKEDLEKAATAISNVASYGYSTVEIPLKTKTGEKIPFEYRSSSIKRESDEHLIISIGRDITERKRAEETLRESEKTLRSIFRAAPIGIGLMSNRVFLQVNDKICEMFGYSRDELVGNNARMLYLSDEDYERVGRIKYEQIRKYGTGTVETRCKCKDGRIIDIILSSTALDPTDFSKGMTFTVLDITERKRAEGALRESEEKFRSLAEQSPNMIFINKKGRIVYINKKCEEVMGYKREELYSPDFDFRILIAPESLDMINDNFARHLRGEEVQTYDYTIIRKDGRRIEVINSSKLIQYEGQKAILGIVTDITERKRAEQALRESEERLKILFESAPDTIYLIDSEGRFMDANRAAFELIGFARDEVISKSLAELDLLSAGQLSKAKENLKKVVAGKTSGPNEYTLKRKDGSYVSIEVRTFPVRIEGRMLTLGIARDITEHKRTEKELLEHHAKLKSLASQLSLTEERERRRLANDLHDQISQSLVISKIKLDQLRKSSDSDEINEHLEDVSNCLGRVIDDTRALTFDLSYPILYELGFEAAVAEWLTEQIQEKHGIKTEFVDDGHQKPLEDDIRVLLFRNVRELLINVVKHAQASSVRVSIRKVKDNIHVGVEDDGVGFDPVDVMSMVAKRAEFGLFSVRERLEQLGGRIEIDSGIGRGSKITMTAPLKKI